MNKKCFICKEEYDSDSIKKLQFYNRTKKEWVKISTLTYRDNRINLCSRCFRTLVTLMLMHEHEFIDFVEEEEDE